MNKTAEKTGYEKMLAGERYFSPDWDLIALQMAAKDKLAVLNATSMRDMERRIELLHGMLGRLGEGTIVFSPLSFEYGTHIFLGNGCMINFDCVFMDGAHITIGDNTLVAPRVQFITASHPTRHDDRVVLNEAGIGIGGYTINKPVTVGSRCWIGASAIILPGITIGDDTVIGAGSVVTRSIPSGVIAAGNPCRVLRPNT